MGVALSMSQLATKRTAKRSGSQTTPSAALDRHEFAVRAVMVVGIAILLSAGVFLLWWARSVFFLLFAGVVFGVFLHGVSEWVQGHTRLSYSWALLIVAVLLLAVLGSIGWFM